MLVTHKKWVAAELAQGPTGLPLSAAESKRQDARDARALEEAAKELDEHVSELLVAATATGCLLGLLINFNVPVLLRGVRRIILTPDLASWRPGA